MQSALTFDFTKLEDALKRQGKIPANDAILTYIREIIDENADPDGIFADERNEILNLELRDLSEEGM